MKRITSMLVGALFLGASWGLAQAQGEAPAAPAAAPAASAAAPSAPAKKKHKSEMQAFRELRVQHHRMTRRLKQNPNLAQDSGFLAKYPDLQQFFNDYPGSQKRFLANPGKYLGMSEAKAKHREETR
ncbi:MAG TPA: hypothetical protein VFB33_07380 [Candidatus Binataceae bacterium]|jgi:hypothetical protein|nr:hypothetical protein [Candidatus Binataceae bacterium]